MDDGEGAVSLAPNCTEVSVRLHEGDGTGLRLRCGITFANAGGESEHRNKEVGPLSQTGRASFLAVVLPLLLMSGAMCPTSSQAPVANSDLEWRRDITQARAEARRRGKPLFVVFRCER